MTPNSSAKSILKAPRGKLLIREGDIDSRAYMILSGSVMVFKKVRGREVQLATLGRDQIFGEMGLVMDTPRTAGVKALEDVTVRVIDREAFNGMLRRDPETLVPVLRALFERLRTMNTKYLQASGNRVVHRDLADASPLPATKAKQVPVIHPKTKRAMEGLGSAILSPDHFPFKIGRHQPGVLKDIFSFNDLLITDRPPFQVSRNHCSLNRHATGGYWIQDRGSRLGTIVNGKQIGGGKEADRADLDRETNSVILGTKNSLYSFEITLS